MALREVIERLCVKQLGRLPDLKRPKGYNDKIQWLKLHDQRRDQIIACDKWGVRDWVAERAGKDVLIPARLGVCSDFLPAYVKCTHDSGSARLARNGVELRAAQTFAESRLGKPYGVDKGEWAYEFVRARIMTEEALAANTDYKFHCVHGRVAWVQVIWDRGVQTKEAIFSPDGAVTGLHMDEKMIHCPDQSQNPGGMAWRELTTLAESLARGWRYVRVDLYWTGRPWFGELTFWPRAGCYRSADEPNFGEMLDIDLTERRQPVVQ